MTQSSQKHPPPSGPVITSLIEGSKPGGSPGVSVCFPAYNEHATIEAVLRDADALLSESQLDYEVLVCDDGSTDGTGEILKRLACELRGVRVIEHSKNQGIRATFEHLYAEAQKEFVFLNSTDQQWETSILLELLPMTAEWDIIVAAREDRNYGPVRNVVSWVFNAAPRYLFGVETHDAGAVKLVRREIIQRFELISRSPFSEAERLIRAARAGYRITRREVKVNPRRTGKARGVKLALLWQAAGDVVRVWRALGRGK